MTCKLPRSARRSWALPALIALSLGCEEGGCNPGCAKCEEAIAHMTDKIEGFSCNPTFMDNAVNRIRDDCDEFNTERILGAIVEECTAAEGIAVGCNVLDVNFRVDFFIDPTVDYPDGVDVHLQLDANLTTTPSAAPNGEFSLAEGESIAWTENITVDSSLEVSITDPADPDNEITFGSEQLSVREGTQYWGNSPIRSVVLTESADGLPVLEFVDF